MAKPTLGEWSREVKGRDGKCLHCGSTQDLHAHHIKPKSSHPELILDVGNGMTLCYRCHKAEHERHRPQRVRGHPQRKTLLRIIAERDEQIADLERAVASLKLWNGKLREIVRHFENGTRTTGKRLQEALASG